MNGSSVSLSVCRTVRLGERPHTPSGQKRPMVPLDCFSSPAKAATCPAAKEEQYTEQPRDDRFGLDTTLIRETEDNTAAVPPEEQPSPGGVVWSCRAKSTPLELCAT